MYLTKEVIQGFVGSVLSSKFDDAVATPAFHLEGWDLFTSKYKYVALAAPRNHAKTTGMTVCYGLSTLLFRERRFMLLVSDTETQAAMFLAYLKTHLETNQALIELFGIKRDQKGIVKFRIENTTDLLVEMEDGHTFRIMAKGAEQSLRGVIWDGLRPDIILVDDAENDELVMNKDRREKMRRWFYSALIPCMSKRGIMRVVGTILHMDSLLERLMPTPYDKFSVQEPLKLWSPKLKNGWKSVKYRAHSDDFEHILWEARWPKENLINEYNNYVSQGLPDLYSQEYLNIPLDEASAYFKRFDFEQETEEEKKLSLTYYVTVDLAISHDSRADYSVFIVSGVDENRKIHVKQVIRERLDAREIVDCILELERIYKPACFGIEDMQVSKSIGPFLYEEMAKQNTYPNIVLMKHGGKDKIARGKSIQARMRARAVCFDKQADWYPTFEDELLKFPRGTHDDCVDAFAYLGMLLNKLVEAPTQEEQDEDIYADEFTDAHSFNGRNGTTGY